MNVHLKNFAFPYYKIVGWFGVTIIFLIPILRLTSVMTKVIGLTFSVLLMTYNLMGDYKSLTNLDELQRLIKLEKGYLLSQFVPMIIFYFYLINDIFKVDSGLSIVMLTILLVAWSINNYINHKYS